MIIKDSKKKKRILEIINYIKCIKLEKDIKYFMLKYFINQLIHNYLQIRDLKKNIFIKKLKIED